MFGITAYGSYVPYWRLGRDAVARAWGRRPPSGEKAVASYDEDSLTMAVDACLSMLENGDAGMIDGVLFSTTTSPYWEKLSASTIAAACNLRKDVVAADLSSSLRSGTSAVRLAFETVRGGGGRSMLIAASDSRLGEPESDHEMSLGDGAACVLVGREKVIAEIAGTYTIADEFLDVWRRDTDRYVQSGEEKFGQIYGYVKSVREACLGAMKAAGIQAADVSRAVLAAPSQSALVQLAKSLGLNVEKQVQDPLLAAVGQCGAAQPLLMLSQALEEAKPGQVVLWAGFGDGADAFILKTTDGLAAYAPARSAKAWIDSKRSIAGYDKYLRFRNILDAGLPSPKTSSVFASMEAVQDVRLHGSKCTTCGMVQYPRAQVCISCREKGTLEDVRLSVRGKVFTYTKDYLFASVDPPTVMAVVDLEGGGRVYLQMTDCDPETVAVGMPVELCFRRFHEGGGFHNYFWKCRPPRAGRKGEP